MRAPAESTRYTIGTPVAYAFSMIRMIFSTVRAPHEPALTVESLAMTQTGRPSTVAAPVTTPSAGRPSASALAYAPSSTKEPSSVSRRIRSRANSLPLPALAAWYFSAPPASMRARSAASWSRSSDTDVLRGARAGPRAARRVAAPVDGDLNDR
jgi:hypothetical protein